jgi:hypothetical protein
VRERPSVGRTVHYVSYGTPNGEYKSECRAAIITAVYPEVPDNKDKDAVSLCVLNPTGQFFNEVVRYNGSVGAKGSPDCPDKDSHGSPFRYCGCGWVETPPAVGGTWHWPERY